MKTWRVGLLLGAFAWVGAIACSGKVVIDAGSGGNGGDHPTTVTTWTNTTWTNTTWTQTGTGTGTWTSSTWTQTGTGTGTPYCDEPDCWTQCECLHPYGVDTYYNLIYCALCDACHDVCEAQYPQVCEGQGQEEGCSAEFINCGYGDCCGECINGDCSLFDVCSPEMQACDNQPDCWQLMNCYGSC